MHTILHTLRITLTGALLLFVLASAAPVRAAESEQAETEASHETEPLNFIDFSSETSHPLAALLFNFGALVVIVYLLMKKPLGSRFAKRKADFEAALKEAEEAKARAEAAMSAANAKMETIDETLATLKEEIIAAGKRESAAIVERAEKQAERLIAESEKLVTQEIAMMAQSLRSDIVEEITAKAARLIQDGMKTSDHDKLSGDYLDRIVTLESDNVKH